VTRNPQASDEVEAAIAEVMTLLSRVPNDTHSGREVAVATLGLGALGELKLTELEVRLLMHQALHPKRGRGGDTYNNIGRNLAIQLSVEAVSRRYGFRFTRSRATKEKGQQESSCSIVAEACVRLGFMLSEEAIAKICRQPARVGN